MDQVQMDHERAVGDAFVDWYNRQNATRFAFHSRGADPPDLVYRWDGEDLLLEITAAYYDRANATMLWQQARRVPGALDIWSSKEPDSKLVDSINLALEKKSNRRYSDKCVLLVSIYADLTDAEEVETLLSQVKVPVAHPFSAAYLAGIFPTSSGGSRGGYRCWKLT